jgi:predicted negative regulator of RcsB-dependent stress response
MRISRFVSLLLFFSLLGTSILGQDVLEKPAPEKDKAALELEQNALDMLDQAVNEAATLKLPENRALIFAMAGDLLWSKNAKRGSDLFREAANNIMMVVTAPEDKTAAVNPTATMFGRRDIANLRRMVLTALAAHDAELALEFLRTTRSADVAAELQAYLSSKTAASTPEAPPKPRTGFNYKAEDEIRLEQALVSKAAEQDPKKAAKMLRESLDKGISYEVLPIIYKVVGKDAELGNQLLSEVFQKIFETDLLKNRNELYFALNLIKTLSGPRAENSPNKALAKLKVEDKTLKDLAVKMADSLMRASNYNDGFAFSQAIPVLEKFVPERVVQLKQKQAALRKQIPDNVRFFESPPSLNDPNATAETLITEAAKAEPQFRGMMYREAANRAFTNGDAEKTRAVLQNQPESKDRDDAIALLDTRLTAKQLETGKLDEARKLIDRMPVGNEKVGQIVQIAIYSFKLNTKESRENAVSLMEEARQMVKDFPEDKDETDGLLRVVAGYALIETPRAFSMLSPVIEQSNDLINASAALAKYNKQNQTFRDGEIVMSNSFGSAGSKFFRYGREMKMLAQADLSKTRGLIHQFRRDDVRIFAKVFIAQGILKEKMGIEGAVPVF